MKKFLLIICIIILSACSKYNYPDDVYYSEPVYPKYEYPEYQIRRPLFNYFLPTYPQFYGPYYYMPYYRMPPPINYKVPDTKPNRQSAPIRKFGNQN
jgi:hypothetical protein